MLLLLRMMMLALPMVWQRARALPASASMLLKSRLLHQLLRGTWLRSAKFCSVVCEKTHTALAALTIGTQIRLESIRMQASFPGPVGHCAPLFTRARLGGLEILTRRRGV